MSATEVLRRLLDERGVEHYDYIAEVWWGGESSGGGGAKYTAYEQTDGLICVEIADLTPEQAIAATLGRGTCHIDQTCHERIAGCDCYHDEFVCSECGGDMHEDFKFCPNCGRKVVDG